MINFVEIFDLIFDFIFDFFIFRIKLFFVWFVYLLYGILLFQFPLLFLII